MAVTDVMALLPAPPIEHVDGRSGLVLRWSGTDVVAVLPQASVNAGAPGEALLASSAVALVQVSGTLHGLLNDWQYHLSCPARFGAVPGGGWRWAADLLRSGRALGTRPDMWGHPEAEGLQWAEAVLVWVAPEWHVCLYSHVGSRETRVGPLARIRWDDTDALASTVDSLRDVEYWASVAALGHGDALQRAKDLLDREARLLRERQEREAREHVMHRDLLGERDMSVDVRRIAKALRAGWGEHAPASTRWNMVFRHVDLIDARDGKKTRVAEMFDIATLERAVRMQIRDAVKTMMAPLGYDVVLTARGRLLIGRDYNMLIAHLDALIQQAQETRLQV